jgi:hypothetical protein
MKTSDLQSEDGLAVAFQQRRRFRGTLIWGVTLVLLLAVVSVHTQEPKPKPEPAYKIKAALLFNFAKFVEWPAEAFADKTSPWVIGVFAQKGQNPFENHLEQTIRGKKVNDRPLRVKECYSVTEATSCHILFICSSETERLPEIIDGLRDTHVLTVGEADDFIKTGGMIRFVTQDKIRFEINDEAAKKVGLKISSKLLSYAIPQAP